MQIFNYILNLLFPPKCIFCGELLDICTMTEMCEKCLGKINFVDEQYWNFYRQENDIFDDVFCVCKYTGIVKDALNQFKFFNKPWYYRAFSTLLHNGILARTMSIDVDMVLSVPMHKNKITRRGFNHTKLISKNISKLLKLPEQSNVMVKIKDTPSQSTLDKLQRLSNVKDSFKIIQPDKVAGKKILLIDDILTTGSTANECSKMLKEAGADKVIVAVIASGRKG